MTSQKNVCVGGCYCRYSHAVFCSLTVSPSVQSSPVQSSPVQSSPVQSSPVQSSPVQSSPVQSSPVQSSPVQSSPVQSSVLLLSVQDYAATNEKPFCVTLTALRKLQKTALRIFFLVMCMNDTILVILVFSSRALLELCLEFLLEFCRQRCKFL